MPKTLVDFIKMLAKKGGVDIEANEEFMNELSAPAFSTLTVSENLEKAIDNSLLSMEVAKNNHPELKKVYFAQAYNGLDSEINAAMDEMKLGDDIKNVILNERSSTKRATLFAKKLQELEQKKKESTSDETRNSLQKQINEAQANLAREKESITKIREDYENQIKEIYTDSQLESLLGGYRTVYDELPPMAKNAALKALVNKALQDSDAVLKVDNNKQLTLLRRDGTNVFGDDNRLLNPQLLIDKVLSSNKVLKVTDSKPNGQNNNSQQNGQNQQTIIDGNGNNGNGQGKKVDHALSAILNRSLGDLERAEKTNVV